MKPVGRRAMPQMPTAASSQPDQHHQSAARTIRPITRYRPSPSRHRRVRSREQTRGEEIALLDRLGGAQPQRALRRLQGGGVDRADQSRDCDHQRELREHLPAQTGYKGRRQKHRHQHQGDADDRPEQFIHRLDRGVVSGHALLDIFRHALDDDDRVIDDDADRQDTARTGWTG